MHSFAKNTFDLPPLPGAPEPPLPVPTDAVAVLPLAARTDDEPAVP